MHECPQCKCLKASSEFRAGVAFQKPRGRRPKCVKCLRSNRSARQRSIYESKGRWLIPYKMPMAEYERMLATQGRCCIVCGGPPVQRRGGNRAKLHVDHCHTSGLVRGLLCPRCNLGMGFIDDAEWLARALDYRDRALKAKAA